MGASYTIQEFHPANLTLSKHPTPTHALARWFSRHAWRQSWKDHLVRSSSKVIAAISEVHDFDVWFLGARHKDSAFLDWNVRRLDSFKSMNTFRKPFVSYRAADW